LAIAATACGGNTNSAVNVTTLTITPGTAPTNGRIIVLILNTSAAITALTVKDNVGAGAALTAGPVQGNLQMFYYVVAGSPTAFTATWTTGVQCSMAVQEYSGATDVNAVFSANHNSGSSTTATIVVSITHANNFIVAGFGSPNSFTTTVGTNRQNTTASTARVELQDNTSVTEAANVTNTATLTSAAWTAVGIELGNAGAARAEQDVLISINSPTSAFARVEQDVLLSVNSVTSAKARVEQDVLIAVISNNLLLKKHIKQYIVTRRKKPKLKKHWGHFQKASLIAAAPYTPIVEKGIQIHRHAVHVKHARHMPRMLNTQLRMKTVVVNTVQPFVFVSC
jgi:hypothetical protein